MDLLLQSSGHMVHADMGAPAPKAFEPINAGVSCGMALSRLDSAVRDPDIPLALLGSTLALDAAQATAELEGRRPKLEDIRDAYLFAEDSSARGPDANLLAFWREVSSLRTNARDTDTQVSAVFGDDLGAFAQTLLEESEAQVKASDVIAAVAQTVGKIAGFDEWAEYAACALGDVVLAKSMRWPKALPMLAQTVTPKLLRALASEQGRGQAATELTQRLTKTLSQATRLGKTLADAANNLKAAAPKLRAKTSDAALDVFLSEPAVAPTTMLSPIIQGSPKKMTDRAARRFCERLVELGVARELTGRGTFRLYGIGP